MHKNNIKPVLICILSLIGSYMLLGYTVGYRLFPPLSILGTTFFILISNGSLLTHGLVSLLRVVAGVFLSLIIGIPCGILLGRNAIADKFLSPILYFLYPIPKITFLPVLLLLMGLGDASKIAIIFLILVLQLLITVRDSTKALDERIYHSIIAFGGGRMAILKHGTLPAILPNIFSALRITSGTAIAVLFIAESFATEKGMGYFIMDSWMQVNYANMHCGIIMLSLIGLLIFGILDLLEKIFCPWMIKE